MESKSRLRVLHVLRAIVALLLMAAAGALGAAAFLLFRRGAAPARASCAPPDARFRSPRRRNAEERVYKLQFQAAADQVAVALQAGLTRKGATAAAAAAILGATGPSLGTFPNVTFPGFDSFAQAQLALAQARALSWNPLLLQSQLAGWQAYAASHLGQLGTTLNATPALLAAVAATANATGVYERNGAGAVVRSDPARPFTTPVWQIAPLAGNAAAVYYDLHSQVDRRVALDASLATMAPVSTAIIQLVQDVRANISRASGIVFAPVHDASAAASAPPFGFVSVVFSWDSFLASALPAFITSVDVVLASPANGAAFTFRVVAGGVAATLPGDAHEIGTEDLALRMDLNATGLGQYFTLAIYPTTALRRSYLSNNPRDACIGVVCIIVAVAAVFKLYDAAATSYSGQLAAAARAAARIVDGVFPASVRKRLFRNASAAASPGVSRQNSQQLPPQRGSMDGGVSALRRLLTRLSDGRAARDSAASATSLDGVAFGRPPRRTSSAMSLPSGAPIADHFDDCTVLFADLEKFTRWSAEVTPERVFSLLEAVFGEFDAAARRLGVFKVETIGAATRQMLMLRACFVLAADLFFLYLFMVAGDCYLAVTGLPEPNARHAEAMAEFALQLPALLRRALESQGLAPDALRLRVGLHSGSVTAGVLRGDRSRFQIFGDAVNTASRMESTGEAGRIQASASTAEALAGASHTLRFRGKVAAKGKGELETFWLERGPGEAQDASAAAPSPAAASAAPPSPAAVDDGADERV